MKRQHHVVCALALAIIVRSASAAPPPTSLNNCQNGVKTATATFIKNKVTAIGTCLQAVSTQIVKNNAADASGAASSCVTQFRKINDSRGLHKQLSDKLAAAISKKCAPGGANTHTLADIIGIGAGVSQPLDAENLNAWCSHYGGDGSIDTLQEWIDCIITAAECDVDSTIASQYPRALEWMNLVKPSMQALLPPGTDPSKITDAVAGLDAVKGEIDGPDNDNIVSIQCGGIVSTGTAVASNCLAGTTFSNGTDGGVAGTMPNNGAVTLTPSTTDQTIALGYHNGLGKCAGDPDLVSSNIKSGVSLFGVNGSSSVVDTSGATATAADMVSGKTAYANGALVTGSATAGSNVDGSNGSKTFTIPDGLYSGSKTATANDSNLVGGNVVTGASIFGVAGTQPPSQPVKTGQTTAYGTGSDADLLKGDARSYTDNGDGTITDNKTGLMWEKKDQSGGIHDYNNTYTWGMTSSPYTMNGTMVTTFLATLNAGGGFAGHTDWRIPNRFELDGVVNLQNSDPSVDTAFNTGCVASCTVTGCSCTKSNNYWSSSTLTTSPYNAWLVYFSSGSVTGDFKNDLWCVRAVRGGS